MKPQYQTMRSRDGKHGDCLRACIASLLELDIAEVPHVLENNSDDWLLDLNAWLAERGLALIYLDANLPACQQLCGLFGADFHHLVTVRTVRGEHHSVIARSGEYVWCPILGELGGERAGWVATQIGLLVKR